ncbi:penicillin binding protein PBP4B [Acetonema longum]|uniref:Beta-lactamase-related domain-containing protein n=1 Tax=Acetonema longum DSM 6540 TaxID=1009370 RepID=F7NGE0_9FIRM|nr:penicillin binding protein PBP4B [Acetonema longum]EGO64895.1 hypothetical protein ALO_05620 [Acetonema longum DSM 6540]
MLLHTPRKACFCSISLTLWFLFFSLYPVGSASLQLPPSPPPHQGWQAQVTFPEADPTSRIHARGRLTFRAYQGQGSLAIENQGATGAILSVNGRTVDISPALRQSAGRAEIDISRYTVNGINTLKVVNIMPQGSRLGIKIPYPTLTYGQPAEVGFSPEKLAKIDDLINQEVRQGFPGAVLTIVRHGKIVKHTAYGHRQKYNGSQTLVPPAAMTPDTLFDLASNTKAFAVNLAMQKLVSEKRIALDDPLSKYLRGFRGGGRERITIRQVLTHSAGYAPEVRFFDPKKTAGKGLYSLDRQTTQRLLHKIPLEYKPGTKTIYSDTDYILLGFLIETVTGQRLDAYVENEIYLPLGLKSTLFNPLAKGFTPDQFAATERNGNTRDFHVRFPGIRTHTLLGEVHDEKAFYSLGGVSGHAGLFSRTLDLAVLSQVILNGGGYGNYRLCDPLTLEQFTRTSDSDSHYGLGWDKNNIWEFGPYASGRAVGHSGWTGTVTCIDPEYDLAIILLTNKVHAPVDSKNHHQFTTSNFETGKYGSIMSLVYEALLEKH